ncbi:MAG: hypothetical protein KF773_39995, partial [Deltaproteobacteria bacterium]|nr:hypothetical protein [Deltaproteobacteria bacterium]
AARMVEQMRGAPRALAWSTPPAADADPSPPGPYAATDVHRCAFSAVSHAAHALAFGHTVDGLAYPEASRRAMRRLAAVAVRTVAELPPA